MYEAALQKCDKVNKEIKKFGDEVYALTEKDNWYSNSRLVYTRNKHVLDRDVGLMIESWEQGSFFNSGMWSAIIDKIFIENWPPAPKTEYVQFAPF